MGKTYLATRLEREDFKRVEKLAQQTNLGKSEARPETRGLAQGLIILSLLLLPMLLGLRLHP